MKDYERKSDHLTDTQKQHPFVLINTCSNAVQEQPILVMKTSGAQYIFQLCVFDSLPKMELALEKIIDPENMLKVPGHTAFLKTAGNMQYIPMERLNPDDVYKDIQECKKEAAEWCAEHWDMIVK